MKWIKLFESYNKETKEAKANHIFGLWLMCKIFNRGVLEDEYDDYGTIVRNYSTPSAKKIISIKINSTSATISISKDYTSKRIREFLTKCGFKNPDTRIYWTWYAQALKKIYDLPDWTKIQTLYEMD